MEISENNIIAYFQPILCAATNKIFSYEVLGRFLDSDGTVKSLGEFFSDVHTTHAEALRVDRIVRRKAMEKFAQENRDEYLFINIRLAWLDEYIDKPQELPTIRWARELGIDTSKIVIEITEEEFNADDRHLNIISYYKNEGCRIALDDYGKNASNIERLALIHPDIIKINIDYIHKSETSYHYREYLKSLAAFAEAVGIEVLFEGIETQQQLEICMASRGRLYQGYIVAYPQPSMNDAVINRDIFSFVADETHNKQYKSFMYADLLKNNLDLKIDNYLSANPFFYTKEGIDVYLSNMCKELPEVIRVYLCNKHGEQISCNFEWKLQEVERSGYFGNNWAWRGFFHQAMEIFVSGSRSGLSSAYRDFTTKERILTYFHALSDDIYLFADIKRVPIVFQEIIIESS